MASQKFDPQKIDGILLLDKPVGLSSNTAMQIAKRIFRAKKAGHTGSLDVLAEGMLPICFGEATKFSQYLLDSDKSYSTVAALGAMTNTGDAEGEIIARSDIDHITQEKIQTVLENFQGEIEQIPPMYSALKFQGKPLYRLAREGIEISRQSRKVFIHNLKLLSYQNGELTLEVRCSKGTYIRTLVEDIGKVLGCGAYVKKLRRTSAGPYQENQMITVEKLKECPPENLQDYLLSPTTALSKYPELKLSEAEVFSLIRGQEVLLNQCKESGCVQIYTDQNQFLGLGEVLADGQLKVRRLLDTSILMSKI
ncbi:MAG: tRNA pseudouridine(55) synthase TruB [Proteobacteria bacterium]|nr:tRNA pseudouridine(55) synthase TruB [Pseudomonadota bacterium]